VSTKWSSTDDSLLDDDDDELDSLELEEEELEATS